MSFFLTYSAEDYEYLLTPAGYAALIVLLAALLLFISYIKKTSNKPINTKQLVFCSMAIALATVTSFIKFSSLPFGGSITLFSMFFICFIGNMYGLKIGLISGLAYGILQLIVGPYIYAPLQVLLDYPLAFGALGLSGLFVKKNHGLMIGCIVGVMGRYLCHVLSGYIYFADYAPENMNPLVYTFGYNATYIVPELIATLIILLIPTVAHALSRVKAMNFEY